MTILMLRPEDRIDQTAAPAAAVGAVPDPLPVAANGPDAVSKAAAIGTPASPPTVMDPADACGVALSPAIGPDRADWIVAGFDLLAEEGWSALSPVRLAARQSSSEAGLFLCFSDFGEILQAMLELWERLALGPLAPDLRSRDPEAPDPATPREAARARLAELAAEVEGAPGVAIEAALREGARTDPHVRAAVERVDRHRLDGLAALLQAAGLPEPQARQRAEVFYAARIGLDYLHGTTGLAPEAPMRALAAAILGLRKAG